MPAESAAPSTANGDVPPNDAAARRSIVMATAAPFLPPYRGDSARVLTLVDLFRERGWRVVVVHRHEWTHVDADYDAMADRCDGLTVYYSDRDRRGTTFRDWVSPEFAALVGGVARAERPDAVLVQFTFMARCFDDLEQSPLRVLDADNLFSVRARRYADAGLEYSWIDARHDEERDAVRKADLVLAVQERELEALRRMAPGAEVLLVPPLVEARAHGAGHELGMLIVSNAYDAQIHGAREFVALALPRIRARFADATLTVVGRLADVLEPAPGLELVGVRDDVDAYYERAALVLNPLPAGTGMKRKTVDALCFGKCLVSTPAGIEGLEAYPDVYRVARTPADFAEVVVGLLERPDEIRSVAERAYAFARHYFSPSARFEPLASAIARAGARRTANA